MFVCACLLLLLVPGTFSCSTLVAGRGATSDKSVMSAHSNDGDGLTVGNLQIVRAANWTLLTKRPVSGGSVPQVAHTFAYFTKVGGYASINQHQVGLAESTCVAVFAGDRSKAMLNIVDLGALGLERAQSAREAVLVMGGIAEKFGYYDNGESLLVTDPTEAFIFHVLPDDTRSSAVWVAQRVPDGHVAVVANSFTVRVVDFNDEHSFLTSSSMRDVARRTGRWGVGLPFDFTRIFAGPEPSHKYASGRRMWVAFRELAAPTESSRLSPTYIEYVSASGYPATLAASPNSVTLAAMRNTMRNWFQNTSYDLGVGMAAGPFGSPGRTRASAGVLGNWERPIAISRTIVSYVLHCRSWLPNAIVSSK